MRGSTMLMGIAKDGYYSSLTSRMRTFRADRLGRCVACSEEDRLVADEAV